MRRSNGHRQTVAPAYLLRLPPTDSRHSSDGHQTGACKTKRNRLRYLGGTAIELEVGHPDSLRTSIALATGKRCRGAVGVAGSGDRRVHGEVGIDVIEVALTDRDHSIRVTAQQ